MASRAYSCGLIPGDRLLRLGVFGFGGEEAHPTESGVQTG
jgi:hypothetical protein